MAPGWRLLDVQGGRDSFAHRQIDVKSGSRSRAAENSELPAMRRNDPMGGGQPEPCPLALFLGRKVRVEYAFPGFLVNPGAGVGNGDPQIFTFTLFRLKLGHDGAGRYGFQRNRQDAAGFSHRMDRIDAQIRKHLMNLGGVDESRRTPLVDIGDDLDICRCSRTNESHCFLDQGRQCDGSRVRFGLPAEGQDMFYEVRRPMPRRYDPGRVYCRLFFRRILFEEQFRIVDDGSQDVVEVMRHAACECADGVHFLGTE